MKLLLIAFILSAIMLFQACTGCGDDDYVNLKNRNVAGHQNEKPQDSHLTEPKVDQTRNGKVVIKMRKENGVYIIPVRLNGTEMDFIFDTGAGIICISDVEANYLLKQGKISKNDVLGSSQLQDATGRISEGTIINLKEVSIGNRTIYDVQASIIHNDKSSLLLGQTALAKFGKITIDYQNLELIFE